MASAESYVGSLISLITKSEIRYEGVLFNINTDESSIGLQSVRSFGSEGRKENGQQIPAGDTIYDYVLFRGSDIKDLQVKFTPPAQATPIHNDPAIIQSHYPHLASASTSLPPVGSGSVADLSSNTAQYGLPSSAVQSNLPLRQPVGNLGSWGPAPSPPSANGSGLPMPMYWPGYYAPSGGHPHLLQPSFLQPQPGLPNPYSAPQPLKYPGINLPVLSGSPNLPQFTDPLLPPVSNTRGSISTPLQYASTSAEASTFAPQASNGPMLDKLPVSSHPASSPGANLPSVPTSTSTSDSVVHMSQSMTSATSSIQRTIPAPTMTYQAVSHPSIQRTIPAPTMRYQAVSHPIPSVGSSSGSQVETSVALITPGQLLQRGPLLPSPQSLKTSTGLMNGEKIPTDTSSRTTLPDSSVSSSEKAKEPLLPLPKSTKTKEPILPLPKPTGQKKNAASYIHHHNVGPGRGRGNVTDGHSPMHHQNVGPGRGRGNETNGASHMQPHNRGPERGRGNEINGASHMPPHNWHPGRGRGNIGNMANGASQMYQYQHNRGPGRGRVNEHFQPVARPVTRFTEEFDFNAMNEKFKKDEVWGHLGNSKAQSTNREGEAKDVSNGELKSPVYCKDDFFDSLSSGKHDYEQSGRRSRLSDQLKLDKETFGVLQRHFVGQNGPGYRGSSRGRGSYYSRGRGYSGNGRGRGYVSYEEL